MASDIILSLTRTTRVGYLRDIRRITVALSRARLGLYVLGRRSVFATCHELREAFAPLMARPGKLVLVSGENWPSGRPAGPEVDGEKEDAGETAAGLGPGMTESVIEGVEHLGQYVYRLTQERVKVIAERQHPGAPGPDSAEAALPALAEEAPVLASAAPGEGEEAVAGAAEVGVDDAVERAGEEDEDEDEEDASGGEDDEAEDENPELGFEKEEVGDEEREDAMVNDIDDADSVD